MNRVRILLLFVFVSFVVSGLLVGTGSAQETPEPVGIPRDAFYERQMAGPVVEAGAQAASLPETIRSAFLRGAIALVFGCYDDQNVHIGEFDAELPLIAQAGAGAVRLTCSIGTFEQGTTGQLNEARYQELRAFVDRAWSYGLVTVVDFHIFRTREPGSGDWSDDYAWHVGNSALENRAISVVTEAARRLSQDTSVDHFTVQPGNEPIDQPTWYDYQRRMFNSIRAACAQCTIAVMGKDWQGITESVYHLDLSPFNGRFYVDFHLYEPIGLTHCEYPGMANNCPGKQYPGVNNTWRDNTGWFQEHGIPVGYFDRNTLRELIREGDEWADQHGVFAILGEIGTTAALDETVRARYLGDIASIAREFGMGFIGYEWHRNFGIKPYPQVVNALFSGQTPPTPQSTPVVSMTPSTPAPTEQPTLAPTAAPTQTGDIDLNELIRLAQEIGTRRTDAQSAQSAVNAAQAAYQVALDHVAAAEQALRDFVQSWIGP